MDEREPKDIGGYSEGVPPLPIPNREVKPLSADGTAKVGEQVAAFFKEASMCKHWGFRLLLSLGS